MNCLSATITRTATAVLQFPGCPEQAVQPAAVSFIPTAVAFHGQIDCGRLWLISPLAASSPASLQCPALPEIPASDCKFHRSPAVRTQSDPGLYGAQRLSVLNPHGSQ